MASTETTDESELWRTRTRQFAEVEIRPRVEAMERQERIDPELRARLGREGFLGLTIPREFGGQEANSQVIVAVLSELARGSAAVATLVSVHLSVASAPIVTWGSYPQKRRYLPRLASGEWLGAFALTEPGAGSDPARLASRYRKEGESYLLDGAKTFITNGELADVLLTFATSDPALGSKGITAFLLPKGSAGFASTHRLQKLGLRASETNELRFEGVRLPEEARLGPEGHGLRVALKALTDGRVGIAACALGVAEAGFDELLRVAREAPSDGTRTVVGQAYTDLLSARALVERAARRKDRGETFSEEASAAKLLASHVAVRMAHRAMDTAGPSGARADSRAGQLLRDARVFPIVEGTSEIQELILGRALIGS